MSTKKKKTNNVKVEAAVSAPAVVEPVIEIKPALTAANQPYNMCVDLLQRAFCYFNDRLAQNELKMVPVITIQSKGRRSAYGWFWDQTWKNGEADSRPEINISAEHLSRTAHNILETLIHEMAHMINAQRKIKDCNAAQYHNRKFKDVAESLGLTVQKDAAKGFCMTSLGDKSKAVVDAFIADNNCSVFDTFNRVQHKRIWRKVFTVPTTQADKAWIDTKAKELGVSQKVVINKMIEAYANVGNAVPTTE